MPSKKSGGARDTERRRRERDARRPKGWGAASRKRIARAIQRASDPLDFTVRLLKVLALEALRDPGMPPEISREQAARYASYLGKAADPKQKLDEMGAQLRKAFSDIRELEERVSATPEPPPDRDGAGEPTEH